MNIVKETAWTVSNIAAGNASQIQALISSQVLRPLVDVLAKGDFKCQKEAAWAVTNITLGNSTVTLSNYQVQEGNSLNCFQFKC